MFSFYWRSFFSSHIPFPGKPGPNVGRASLNQYNLTAKQLFPLNQVQRRSSEVTRSLAAFSSVVATKWIATSRNATYLQFQFFDFLPVGSASCEPKRAKTAVSCNHSFHLRSYSAIGILPSIASNAVLENCLTLTRPILTCAGGLLVEAGTQARCVLE